MARLQDRLGRTYLGLGLPAKAESLFAKAVATRQVERGADDPLTLASMHNQARAYHAAGKQPEDWTTLRTLSLLGSALMGQQKYAEAEPLLLEGYQRTKQKLEKDPKPIHHGPPTRQRLTEALERLVQLYDAWGKPDVAAKWRKELGEASKSAVKPEGS